MLAPGSTLKPDDPAEDRSAARVPGAPLGVYLPAEEVAFRDIEAEVLLRGLH